MTCECKTQAPMSSACISSHSGAVMLGHNPLVKFRVVWDVYFASERQKSILLGPFGGMDSVGILI